MIVIILRVSIIIFVDNSDSKTKETEKREGFFFGFESTSK